MTDKFHDYLFGVKLTVMTDNNPLLYVLTTGKFNSTGHRWLAALATFDFVVNIDADLLSRNGMDMDPEPWMRLSLGDVKTICGCECACADVAEQ